MLLVPQHAVRATEGPRTPPRRPPNIVLIVTDDQRWDTLPEMSSAARMAEGGVVFPNAFVPNPLCCPSRVTILTGHHSHTTGVYTNGSSAGYGGFAAFDDRASIATALDPGYRTGMIGKYLNGYPGNQYGYVPPGWDTWAAIATGNYYDYDLAINGRRSRWFGESPDDYSGRVLTARALRFVARPSPRPFFLLFAPVGVHASSGEGTPVPDPLDDGALDGTAFDHPPSFDEPDMSDKPLYLRNTHIVDRELFRQKQLEALMGVDRSIGMILDSVPDNTLVVLTSDNGYLWGEHRWWGKIVPYNESLRVPLVATCIGCSLLDPGAQDDRLVSNIDLAVTLLDAAGLPRDTPTAIRVGTDDPIPPGGRSLLRPGWTRDALVLEHWSSDGTVPSYCGIRTPEHLFVHYQDGFEEVYDEVADPWETSNIAGETGALADVLREQAVALCDPVPPGFAW
jgi:arylsulfatase A-like enzyme